MNLTFKHVVLFCVLGVLVFGVKVVDAQKEDNPNISKRERQAFDLLSKRGCLLITNKLGHVVQATLAGEKVTVENIDYLKCFPSCQLAPKQYQ